QKLRLADLAVHRAARRGREDAAIDQLQRRIELVGEILRAPAIIRKRRDGGERVLVSALTAERGLHAPDGDQRPRRNAVTLLDAGEQRSLRLLQRTPARNDRRAAALGEKFRQRETEAALAAVGIDRRRRVTGLHQRRDAGSTDALRACF